jgi:Protein of unknown function (DUF3892)
MAVRITCINKSQSWHQDPHHAISHLGWINEGTGQTGKSTRLDLYDFLKNQNGQANVTDYNGNQAAVYPRENQHGTKYVQTYVDNVWTDNLLSLPECL